MRTLPTHNPADFQPPPEQAGVIEGRRKLVRRWATDRFRDPAFQMHSIPDNVTSMHGILYRHVLMVAKAAQINAGQNLFTNWVYFEIEMQIPWQGLFDMSDHTRWIAIGARMSGEFYRTDMEGDTASSNAWIPELVVMSDFTTIPDVDALNWIGVTGGELPTLSHSVGTLRHLPRSVQVMAGTTMVAKARIAFGTPPYVLSFSDTHPTWATLVPSEPAIQFIPPRGTGGQFSFMVTVTDANGETAESFFDVSVN